MDNDPDLGYLVDPMFHKVKDYFGLEFTEADRERRKLLKISDWAKKNAKENEDAMEQVRSLGRTVGDPVTERKYNTMYRYIVLNEK